jgi:hypothetical protein
VLPSGHRQNPGLHIRGEPMTVPIVPERGLHSSNEKGLAGSAFTGELLLVRAVTKRAPPTVSLREYRRAGCRVAMSFPVCEA